jgi:uncharacterized protein (DUF2236 family)
MDRAIRLPAPLLRPLDALMTRELLQPAGATAPLADFAAPRGEPALLAHDSVTWHVCRNPLVLFVGGIAAVLFELAEPRVRSGVWQFTSFRDDPRARMQRTGLATLLTVYGPRGRTEAMVARVRALHARVGGVTPDGVRYAATDVELLDWVHATAAHGFVQAYETFVRRLDDAARDRYYAEGTVVAQLYGACGAAASQAELLALFESMRPRLERSDIVFDFLRIVGTAPLLPRPLAELQPLFVRAAVAITPAWLRERLGLDAPRWAVARWQRGTVVAALRAADRLLLPSSPPVQACRRLGLPDDYLYQ